MAQDAGLLLDRYLAVARAIAGQMDFQSALKEIAGEIHGLFGYDHMDVAIVPADRPDCIVAFEVGMATKWAADPGEPKAIVTSPIRELLWGRVDHIRTDDARVDGRFHFEGAFDAPIFEADLRSRIHVPLKVHGVVHGALNISSHQVGKYDDDDVAVARQVADLLAPYFYSLIRGDQAKAAALAEGAARGREEALRLGALKLTEGMEDERKRLGMDLHDQTLADLTRIARRVSNIRRQASPAARDPAELEAETSACVSELRRIIEDTRPGVLELFGFAQAVEAQLERSVAGLTPAIAIAVVDEASALLDASPESVRTTLFRIVQEAINNAVRHSAPRQIRVSIGADRAQLYIVVADDGTGTLPSDGRPSGGLDNMRVRAALISAQIDIAGNEPGGGTRVAITIPLTDLGKAGPSTESDAA